eukprot:365043-Chlamydomonas_euryale.AAC.25
MPCFSAAQPLQPHGKQHEPRAHSTTTKTPSGNMIRVGLLPIPSRDVAADKQSCQHAHHDPRGRVCACQLAAGALLYVMNYVSSAG